MVLTYHTTRNRTYNLLTGPAPCNAGAPLSHSGRVRRARLPGGFTLLEVMGAITLLVVGLFSAFVLFMIGIQVDAESSHYSIARVIAQQQIEYVRSLPYASVAALGTGAPIPLPGSQPAAQGGQPVQNMLTRLPNGSGRVDVSTVSPGLVHVTIAIDWIEPGRGSDHFKVDTNVAQGGWSAL